MNQGVLGMEANHQIDEAFIRHLEAARMQESMGGSFEEIVAAYLRAANSAPHRAEALWAASRLCRLNNKFAEGYEYSRRGLTIERPADGLSVEPWIYEYGLLDEFAVNAYWAGAYQDCLDACERLLREGKIRNDMRDRVIKNADFARKKLFNRQAGKQLRIVATMTTIPSRIDLIRPAIESVLAQTVPIQHVELNIPYHCIRTNEAYHLPGWLESMDRVQIFRTEDYGPITKVAPTLLRYRHNSQTYIWSIDDDFAYPLNQLELLCSVYDPDKRRILTRYGGALETDGTVLYVSGEAEVTRLAGFGGVLYPPGCIGEDFQEYLSVTSANADCRKNDDIVLTMYFNAHKMPIYLYNCPSDETPFWVPGELPNANRDRLFPPTGWTEDCRRIIAFIDSLRLSSNPSAKLSAATEAQCGAFLDPALLAKSGRRVYSQNDEDGIIEFLISALGLATGYFVEIGVGPPWSVVTADGSSRRGSLEQDGLEANCRLLLERGWHGLMLDSQAYPDGTGAVQAFVTALNVNLVLQEHQCPSDVDIFSLDIDGQDFWVWMNLILRPKIMIIEYNGELDLDESLVVPFDTEFRWDGTYYQGASLLALKKLGDSKFYSLVYANGVNAFFVRADLISNHDEFTIAQIYRKSVLHRRDKRRRPWVLI